VHDKKIHSTLMPSLANSFSSRPCELTMPTVELPVRGGLPTPPVATPMRIVPGTSAQATEADSRASEASSVLRSRSFFMGFAVLGSMGSKKGAPIGPQRGTAGCGPRSSRAETRSPQRSCGK
jgi:hypothetical protein